MRKWSPSACDNNEKGKTVYQIVVPTVHRREVLELAHDLPVSGHLGVRKTYNRVLQHTQNRRLHRSNWQCQICYCYLLLLLLLLSILLSIQSDQGTNFMAHAFTTPSLLI